jgi:hypothetical protein
VSAISDEIQDTINLDNVKVSISMKNSEHLNFVILGTYGGLFSLLVGHPSFISPVTKLAGSFIS